MAPAPAQTEPAQAGVSNEHVNSPARGPLRAEIDFNLKLRAPALFSLASAAEGASAVNPGATAPVATQTVTTAPSPNAAALVTNVDGNPEATSTAGAGAESAGGGDADDSSDSSSTLATFRDRLQWLNEVTAAAQRELDAVSPPPLKSALEDAVKKAASTDLEPVLGVTKRVLGDLQEGFQGLGSAAKEFDPGEATKQLKERMQKELEARQAAAEQAAAAGGAEGVKEGTNAPEQIQKPASS